MQNVSIYGLSTTSLLASLLLSKEGVNHSFYVNNFPKDFNKLTAWSNPITNYQSYLVEKEFIPNQILKKIPYIQKYNYKWYNNLFKPNLKLSGKYSFPIYAIDSRLRMKLFSEKVLSSFNVNVFKDKFDEITFSKSNSSYKLIGANSFNNSLFQETSFSKDLQFRKRSIFGFNLFVSNPKIELFESLQFYSVSDFADFIFYPFLHVNEQIYFSLVICRNDEDHFFGSETTTSFEMLQKIINVFNKIEPEIAHILKGAILIDEIKLSPSRLKPFFKEPIKSFEKFVLLGIGEAIFKTDPITAQGYNIGVKMTQTIIKSIDWSKDFKNSHNENILKSLTENFNDILLKLFLLNEAFVEQKFDFNDTYVKASHNENTKSMIFDAIEDINLYFPWIVKNKK